MVTSMTVDTTGGGGAVALPEDYGNIGMEDVDASDLMLPRLKIDHKRSVFVNSVTKEEFSSLTIITLGLIKGRIMWHGKLEDDSKPQCKSPDNIHGFPNVNENDPKKYQFPWANSNFEPNHMEVVELAPGQNQQHPNGWSSNGHGTLQCSSCAFAKWSTDDDGKGVPPPCNEQHIYPILYMQEMVDETGEQSETRWVPALFTVAKSAIKNSRSYINSFAQAKQPMFTMYTFLTLRPESRAGNDYAVPEWRRATPTDRNMWGEYGQQYKGIRELMRSAPRPGEDTNPPATDNTNQAPATVAPPVPPSGSVTPPVAPPTATVDPTPEPPPPAPTPPASPAPAPPAQAPTPPPQATTPPPPPAAPPVAPPAPPAPPASAVPQMPQTGPPPADPPQGGNNSGLPF